MTPIFNNYTLPYSQWIIIIRVLEPKHMISFKSLHLKYHGEYPPNVEDGLFTLSEVLYIVAIATPLLYYIGYD